MNCILTKLFKKFFFSELFPSNSNLTSCIFSLESSVFFFSDFIFLFIDITKREHLRDSGKSQVGKKEVLGLHDRVLKVIFIFHSVPPFLDYADFPE